MRKKTHKELGSPTSLSLAKMLENKKLKLGVRAARSYGESIDKILEKYKGKGNIYQGYQGNESKSMIMIMIMMLAAKRFDYLIEYPDEGEFIARKIGVDDALVPVTISEMSDLSWSSTACSKTEWGRKAINRINKALLKLRPTQAYREAYGKILNKNLRSVYQKTYDEIFLKLNE